MKLKAQFRIARTLIEHWNYSKEDVCVDQLISIESTNTMQASLFASFIFWEMFGIFFDSYYKTLASYRSGEMVNVNFVILVQST